MSVTLPEPADPSRRRHSSHWGAFDVIVADGRIARVEPFEHDSHPSRLIEAVPEAVYSASRIDRPYVRTSWLEHGPGARTNRRGSDAFAEPGAGALLIFLHDVV